MTLLGDFQSLSDIQRKQARVDDRSSLPGASPIEGNNAHQEVDEEVNVLYVAATRAFEQLFLPHYLYDGLMTSD